MASPIIMRSMLLTVAALGMVSYGAYEVLWAIVDLVRGARLELWAELGLMLFGVLLALAAAFVRVRLPGGLAFAIGALLGLQALAVHNAVHVDHGLAPQIGRGILAVVLVGLAYSGKANRGAGGGRRTP
jgi:hypothetical protein